jgi:hypothetical protein
MSDRLPNAIDRHVASRLRLRRREAGLTQQMVADALGLPGTRKPVIGVTLPHIYALLGKGGPRRAFLPTPRPCVAGGMREGARPRSHFTIAVRAERLASAVTGPAALRCSQQFAAPRPRRASAEDCGKGLLTLPSISRYSTFAQMKPVRACGSFPLSCCCLV